MRISLSRPNFASILESIIVAFGRSPIVAILGVGLVFSVFNAGAVLLRQPWQQQAVWLVAIGVFVLALFEFSQRLARRAAPIPALPFLVVSLAVGLLIRLIYVIYIQPEWYTDFLRYWQRGIALASSESIVVADIYSQRALFLTRPLVEIFGPNKVALVVSNALLLTFIQGVGYDLVRRARSHQAAQAFTVLWIAAPEPLLTTALPNHDLAGLALTVTAMWLLLFAQSARTPRSTLLLAAIAGGVLALLEVVRGLGLLFCIVLAALFTAAVTVQACREGRVFFKGRGLQQGGLTLAMVVVSLWGTLGLLERAGVTVDHATTTHLKMRYTTPHSTSLSDGTHAFYLGFTNAFTNDLEEDLEGFARFRHSIVLSDFIGAPLSRVEASLAQMQRQYALGSQQNFYLRGMSSSVRRIASVYTAFYLLGFAILLLSAILRQLRAPLPGVSLAHFLLLFTATTSMTLLLFGENQPRYLFTIWFAGAVVIPWYPPDGEGRATTPLATSLIVTSALALASLALVALLLASTTFKESNGRILSDWEFSNDLRDRVAGNAFLMSLQDNTSDVLLDSKGRVMPRAFGPLSLKLMLPQPPSVARIASAEKLVCGIRSPAEFEFQFDAPWKRKPGAFSLTLEANKQQIWHAPLPNHGAAPERVTVRLPAGDGGCVRLKFLLRSHVTQSKASWQRASFVEIFFPRIAPAD